MKILFKVLLFLFFLVVFGIILFSITEILISSKNIDKVCFEKNRFSVEIAKTQNDISRGLMFRNYLEKNTGMLFIFEKESVYPFWMKNTLIPLDMIWIDGENKIVFIKNNAQPCKELNCGHINPQVRAKYVLEINAGTAKNLGLKIGDKAIIE